MVSPAVGASAAGALLGIVAVGIGVAFMTNDSFALSSIQCNPDVLTSASAQAAAQPFCNSDNRVIVDGEVCQTGNLGLYTASFTPECSYDTPYAISTLLAPSSGDPLTFTPLFSAQTGFGTVTSNLGLTAPEFEDCDQFFGTGIAQQMTGVAAAGNFLPLFTDSFIPSVKASYDAAIVESLVALNESGFQNASQTVVTNLYLLVAGALGPASYGTDYAGELVPASGQTFDQDLSDVVTAYTTATLPIQAAQVEGIRQVLLAGNAVRLGATDPDTDIQNVMRYAVAFGTPFTVLEGVPESGPWTFFNSSLLCSTAGFPSGCTYKQYLEYAVTTLTGSDQEDLQELLNFLDIYAGAVLTITDVEATGRANGGDAGLAATVSTAAVTAFVQGLFNASAPLGSSTGFPDSFLTPMNATNPAMASVCDGVGLVKICSVVDFLTQTSALLDLAGDTDSKDNVDILLLLLGTTCAPAGNFTITGCAANTVSGPISNTVYSNVVLTSVFGSFYSFSAFEDTLATTPQTDLVNAMISQCKDDEVDAAAISLAQITTPVGAGLIGVGALAMVANLAMLGDKAKIIGLIAALLAAAGVGLVLAGLLTLQGAPIYSALTEEAPAVLPDNVTVFATSIGLTLAFAFIGGGLVSALLLIGGGLFLQPKDSSTDILGKA